MPQNLVSRIVHKGVGQKQGRVLHRQRRRRRQLQRRRRCGATRRRRCRRSTETFPQSTKPNPNLVV